MLNRPYQAPNGQIKRQKGRNIAIDKRMTTIARKDFQAKIKPNPERKPGFKAVISQPASMVPAGQMNLQKAGEPTPFSSKKTMGKIRTNTIPITYFKLVSFLVKLFFASLGVGSL